MNYEVYVGNKRLYGVSSVDFSNERDVSVCEGLGQGKFTVPGSAGIESWNIKCELTEEKQNNYGGEWTKASRLIRGFKNLLATKEPTRLSIQADFGRSSQMVILKGMDCTEQFAGVYDVTLKFLEYQKVESLSEDVPPVTRPGKVPEFEETASFPKITSQTNTSVRKRVDSNTVDDDTEIRSAYTLTQMRLERLLKRIQDYQNDPLKFDLEHGVPVNKAEYQEMLDLKKELQERLASLEKEKSTSAVRSKHIAPVQIPDWGVYG